MSSEKTASTRKKKAGKSRTSKPGKPMEAPEKGVRVRMYRTGLGDCFLLAFPRVPTRKNPRDVFYLMIDCGVYYATPEKRNAAWIREIVQDIKVATQGRIDLLVITHEHWDHVSAFHPRQAQSIFKNDQDEIELGALWMAWTENMDIPLARQLHQGRRDALRALTEACAKMAENGLAKSATKDLVGKVLSFFGEEDAAPLGAAKKSVLTEEAMDWLRDVYGKGKTRFLEPGEGPLPLDGVRDVRIYVLGPPEDPELIHRHEPEGSEVYPKVLGAIEASFFAALGVIPSRLDAAPPTQEELDEARRMSLPFDEMFQIKLDEVDEKEDQEKKEARGLFRSRYFPKSASWRRIDGDWMIAAEEFALQLDNATNNTSLAFALEIGPPGEGQVLLFPGDAQVGSWLSWFGKVTVGGRELGKEMKWKVDGHKITAEDLLRRTVLYKVGHHGSHNATLRARGLELMGRRDSSTPLVAFLPVDESIARETAKYGEMPLRSLVKELMIRTNGRIARNDFDTPWNNPESAFAPFDKKDRVPDLQDFPPVKNSLFLEYTVEPD